jgi:hypothetical protein
VTDALLAAARAHYLSLGKESFVFLGRADEEIPVAEALGYDFVSDGVRWLAKKSLVPAWLSFVQNSLAS